jgi:oligoendopeptidase F
MIESFSGYNVRDYISIERVIILSNWNLSIFYDSLETWENDLKLLPEKIDHLASFKGKLHDFDQFKAYYLSEEETVKLIYKLYAYIHLDSDLNLKDTLKSSKNQQMMLMLSNLQQKTSYVSPEIISIGEEKVMSFVEKDPFLKPYQFGMKKLFLQQEHVLSSEMEKLLSNFAPVNSIPSTLYQSLAIVDAKDEVITLKNGSSVTVTLSNYRSLIPTLEDKEDRRLVFEAAFKRYKDHKTAFAGIYNLVLQNQAAYYKSRNYPNALEAALFKNNIPTDVFHTLVNTSYQNTEPIKRYIELRKKHLKLDTYRTYDRFMKLAKDDTKYPFTFAKDMFFEAISGMNEAFTEAQHKALEDGFVDAYPKDGKRTGAYSSGFYGYHPYILLNHDDTLDAVFTLAHEAGHSAHTILSNQNQPMATSSYTIFVAEIASTFNEHVLLDHLIKKATSKTQKIDLLESALDGIMGTFFRQTLFANFEFLATELVREGKPITHESLSKIMSDLYKHYYDIDIKEENGKEYVWAYIPHFFHTPFYVYQYATSFSASLKIYENVRKGNKDAMDLYLNLLKSGGSDFPVNQAKNAGADLTDQNTFLAVIHRFNELLDQLEKVLEE